MKTKVTLIIIILIVMSSSAWAEMGISFNPASQSGFAWGALVFNGTLTNNGEDTLFINGLDIVGLEPGISLDSDPFFQNAPESLEPGQSWTGDMVEAMIDPAALPGNHICSVMIVGGTDEGASEVLAIQNFMVQVLPDYDADNDVDRDDMNIILTYKSQPASAAPQCDLDRDGTITVLDARILVTMCSRPACACQ